jgi:hypothetical protein
MSAICTCDYHGLAFDCPEHGGDALYPKPCPWCGSHDPTKRRNRAGIGLCNNTFYHHPLFVEGQWVEQTPKTEGMCSYSDCTKQATWTRKMGWMVAPGSPPGDVCEKHHCWEPIPTIKTPQSDMVTTKAGVRFQPRSRYARTDYQACTCGEPWVNGVAHAVDGRPCWSPETGVEIEARADALTEPDIDVIHLMTDRGCVISVNGQGHLPR